MLPHDPRLLLCIDGQSIHDADGHLMAGTAAMGPVSVDPTLFTAQAAGGLSSIPALNSNLGAKATLYLDFDGDGAMSWGSYSVPQTPAYDRDGDGSTFSDAELDAIRQIWARVSEKFSPFSISVTTVNPGAF